MDITLTHIPREEVLRYLGCPGTEDPATLALVEGCSARLLAAARPKWTYRIFGLAVQTDGVRLDCGLLLPGRDLAAHLRGCSRAALLAATLSAPVDALLRRAQADILLLDEAFSALDYQTRLNVTDDVYRILKREQVTTLMVTHDIPESISMGDKILVLSARPAQVKEILSVDFGPGRSPLSCRANRQFGPYFDHIWKELSTDEKS